MRKLRAIYNILAHSTQLSRGLASSCVNPVYTGSTNNKQGLSVFPSLRCIPRLSLQPNSKMDVIHILQPGNLRFRGSLAQVRGGLVLGSLTSLTSSCSCFSMQCDCSVPADKICSRVRTSSSVSSWCLWFCHET